MGSSLPGHSVLPPDLARALIRLSANAAGAPGQQFDAQYALYECTGDVFGTVFLSPNRCFIAGIRSGFVIDGYQSPGFLVVANICARRILFTKRPHRVRVGGVSSHGHLIYNEPLRKGLGGTVSGFSPTGERVWAHDLRAHVADCGVSADATRAFINTCHTDYEPHSQKLIHLDFANGSVLWSTAQQPHPDVRMCFKDERLVAIVKEGIYSHAFEYGARGDLTGEAFEEFRLRQDVLAFGPVFAFGTLIGEALAQNPPDIARAQVYFSRLQHTHIPEGLKQRARVLEEQIELAAAAVSGR